MVNAVLKFVTYDGVPLTFFSGDGFQGLLGKAAKTLDVALGRDVVRVLVINRAAEEKKALMDKLVGKMIVVKMDGVTRTRSHFLGITIQYYDEEKDNIAVKVSFRFQLCAKNGSFESLKHLKY